MIDIAQWQVDDVYFNYPEGARSKNAFFPPPKLELGFVRPSRRYLFKRSDKRYPDQFWGEVVAYQVGGLLNVNVPPAYAAYNSNDGDCGALIEWFYDDGKASFIPGGQYMQRMMPDFDRKRGRQHNFHSIQVLGRAFAMLGQLDGSWEQNWAEAFLFDALIGNTDRHQDNWGCLYTRRKNATDRVSFAPLFDNGTSLGHERFPENVAKWSEADYQRYVNKGTHHVRWQKDDASCCGHIELLTRIADAFPFVVESLRHKIAAFDINALRQILDHLCGLALPIALTQNRKNLYIELIALRKNKIETALK